MSKVLCGFRECIYNQDRVCTKDVINLDERVEDIFVGCPDTEWEEKNKHEQEKNHKAFDRHIRLLAAAGLEEEDEE